MADIQEDNQLLKIEDNNCIQMFLKTEDNYIIKQVIDGVTTVPYILYCQLSTLGQGIIII